MLLLLCFSLLAGAAGVIGQTPPATPCPEVFQYWFQNGQWAGHVIVPVEEDVEEVTVVTSLFVYDIIPPVPGGLHPTPDITGVYRNVIAGWKNNPSIEYKLIFPVQSPLPLLDKITVNNDTICQGVPAKVRYATESTCRARLKGLLPSQSNGPFGRCDSHHTVLKLLSAPAPAQEPSTKLGASASVDNSADNLPPPSKQPKTNNGRTCPNSPQYQKTKKKVTCGIPLGPVRTIYNGMSTQRGDWPWLVALYHKYRMQLLCGATLISARHAITAAHCFKDPVTKVPIVKGDVLVLLGKYDFSKWNESDVQCPQIEQIVIYPDYQERTIRNDIAILILETRVNFNVFVIPICLFKPDMDTASLQTGTVVGWGKEEKTKEISDRPLVAMVPIVSQETCIRSNDDFENYVNDRTMCAGHKNGTGPCNGDSGGGLLVTIREPDRRIRWYLRGIVSFNLKGIEDLCHLNEYSLFTDVSRYTDWIEKILRHRANVA